MEITVLKGTLVQALRPEKAELLENGYLILEDGVVAGIYARLPAIYRNFPVADYGNCLVLQGFADMHLHAPQYPMLGTGMDLPLLPWLQTHVFPTEARFADAAYARRIYHQLARDLIEHGTTRVCMFSSLHTDATLILMEELENAGVSGFVGKVNMDRNGAPCLQETTADSIFETLRWLDACGKFHLIRPILTPRFTPSCTNELLAFLGKLSAERRLPVQSHLSENRAEMDWVRTLHPDCGQYWETYAKYGLWKPGTVMAHCVHSDERERRAMRENGVLCVHCANSNTNLCSGVAPIRAMLDEGVSVALGSDIAGGAQLHMHEVVAASIRASKMRQMGKDDRALSTSEAYYLASSAGASFFGAKSGFAVGDKLHAFVLDDSLLPELATNEERFERSFYTRQNRAIRAVWAEGRNVLLR